MLLIKNLRIFYNIIRYYNESASLCGLLFSINNLPSFEDFFYLRPSHFPICLPWSNHDEESCSEFQNLYSR